MEALVAMGGYEVVGWLDPRRELWGTEVLGARVLGNDDLLGRHYDDGVAHVFIGLGGAADTRPRRRLHALARSHGFDLVSAFHPSSVVSASATIGPGATILAGAVINAGALLGENVIINTGAIVEHDCSVGDHAHVSTGARLASSVEVADGVHVGAGATVIQGIRIGTGAVVGAGAVVIRDVEPGTIVVGVPAQPLRKVER
jgi:UDP-perosamine 4-acetyltransferase